MTIHKDLKAIIRERQSKTGESYTAARAHVMRAQAELLGQPECPVPNQKRQVDAIVLKINQQSMRVRLLTEDTQLTFRSTGTYGVIPGHTVTLTLNKRWTWRGDAYASGAIENPRIDIGKLALTPLPLNVFDTSYDLRTAYEPYRSPDPYAPLWRKLTAKPRASYEMDPIAWGAFPDDKDGDYNPTCDAAELAQAGDVQGARALLMEALLRDLRCIDAHAHLGNLEFDRRSSLAIQHYEIGMRIGELSLPPSFNGTLLWGHIYNRPFLRCLYGYGLCLWRLGRSAEARMIFERILAYNPNDNQGARFSWEALGKGITWEEFAQEQEEEAVTIE